MEEKALNPENVSVYNTCEGGVAFFAPKGTAAPTEFCTPDKLDPAFKSLGDMSDDGIDMSIDSSSTDYKNINGSIVLSVSEGKTHKITLPMIETKRAAVEEIYNGKVTLGTGGEIKSVDMSNAESAEGVLVVYELLSDGTIRMYVYDRAKPSEFGSQSHKKKGLIVSEVTFTALDNGKNSVGTILYGVAA